MHQVLERLFRIAGLGIGALLGLVTGPVAAAVSPDPTLAPSVPVERALQASEKHAWTVRVRPGDFVHVSVEQRGIDLVLAVRSGEGPVLREMDSPNGEHGTEELSWIAAAGATLTFEVRASDPDGASGTYVIRLDELRPATAADARRVEAEAAFAEGAGLLYQEAAESRRRSIEPFRRAGDLWHELGDRVHEAMALYSLARAENSLDRPDAAVELYGRSLAIWREVGDRRSIADTLYALAQARRFSGAVDRARTEFREALEVAREVSDRGLESEILTSLGDLEDSVGESQKALADYALALPIARESNNRNAECRLIHNMAVVRDFLGESQRALDGYREVLTLCRSLGGKRAEAQVLTSIGRLYIDLGEREAGLQHLASAAALALEVGDQRSRARILFHVGRARERAGEVDAALAAYAEARDLGRQAGEPFREAAARGMIAGILGARGDPSALSEFDRALELARAGKSPWVESVVLKGRGRFLAARGDRAAARADLSLAAEIDHRTGDRLGEAESRFELARLERSSGRLAEAWTFASTALDLMEALRTEVASHDLRAAFFATSQDLYEFSVDLLMELGAARPGEGFETTAWTVHERSRARSLLDVLSARDSVSGHVDPALLERERSLRKRIARATDDPTRVAGDARESVTAAADVEKLRSEYETVRRSIQSSNPEYAALAFGDPVSIERVQSELGADALLAEFHLGEARSFLWIIGRDSVRTFVLPPRAPIERSAEALYGELRAPGSDWHGAASDLGSQLLQSAASLLSSRVLVVVPDGTLQLIPFAVLGLPGQTTGELVVARFEVVQVPSASVLTLLRRDAIARTAARTLAVLADPVLDASDPRVHSSSAAKGRPEPSAQRGRSSAGEPMPRLPFTRREASAIGDLVPAANRRIALGFDANLDLARSAELGGYRYVHFATHAVTGGEHPERAALVLSRVTPDGRLRDGLLPVAEIFNLRLSADLVVLSACQTALGRSVRGEGLLGLARAFMYAGAPRVVASLWRVDDSATAELMRRFYGGMLGREHFVPGEALRRAQLSVSATKRWADPYYWAGFVLQGDWR